MAVVEGKAAPDFALTDIEGKKVTLKDFAGKDLILYFYPKDDTPGCTKEACGFRDGWKDLAKAGAVVVGVSADGAESHKKFIAKYKLPFPLLSDPDRKVMEKYGAYGEKMMYGKKTVGVIRSTVWIGADGRVKKHWKKVANAGEAPGAGARRAARGAVSYDQARGGDALDRPQERRHTRVAFVDGFLGAVEIEQPNVPELRRHHDVGRIAGHAAAGDAVLHDVDRAREHLEEARSLLPRPQQLAGQEAGGAAELLAQPRRELVEQIGFPLARRGQSPPGEAWRARCGW